MLFSEKKTASQVRKERIAREHAELTERLSCIRAGFDMAEEQELIDALIFEENAVLSRLAALYKSARADGVTLEVFEIKK